MNQRGVDVVATAKALFSEFREDDLQGQAAQVAYHLLFSVVPLLMFLTAMSGFISRWIGVDDAMKSINKWLVDNLPTEAAEALQEPIRSVVEGSAGGILSFGALLALWSGKNAIAALMKALNVVYGVEETRPWLKKTGIAVGLTIALGGAIVAASVFFLAGSFIGEEVADAVGLSTAWATVWSVLRFPLIALILVAALGVFYWAAPNVDQTLKWLTPGSVLAVVLWAITTFALGFYFQYFGPDANTYGVLGGVLAFIFWLYVMSIILLIGAELNAVLQPAFAADGDPRPWGVVGTATGTDRMSRPVGAAAGPIPATNWNAVQLPSAEHEARLKHEAEGAAASARRVQRSLAALGASAVAAVTGIFVGTRRE